MFATNQMPSISNAGEAFYNRLLFVEFPNTVPRDEQDKQLSEKLENERAGILNWMLDGLDRLLAQGHFTGERSINSKKELCDAFGGVVDRFTHNCLMVTGIDTDVVVKSDLENLAQRYAEDIDKDPEWSSQSGFTQMMGQQIGVQQGQKRIDGDNPKVFTGVRVKPEVVHEYQADVRALTDSEEGSQNTGLSEYGDEVRPGYDMRKGSDDDVEVTDDESDESPDETPERSDDDPQYKYAVRDTVAEADGPVGMAYIIQHTEGTAEPLRDAIDRACSRGLISKNPSGDYIFD
jgi:phage/plasmid-associated DNA primase